MSSMLQFFLGTQDVNVNQQPLLAFFAIACVSICLVVSIFIVCFLCFNVKRLHTKIKAMESDAINPATLSNSVELSSQRLNQGKVEHFSSNTA